jgi:cytochrome b
MSADVLIKVRIWDLPTRLFHWGLVVALACLAVSGTIGGGAMVWHFRFGYAAITLLVFRVIWGLIGGRWSRFNAFIYAPRSVLRYLRGHRAPEHLAGHSPLGALSVFAMLAVLLAQAGTGLLSDDEIAAAGPLTRFVSSSTVSLATSYHARVGKWLLLALVLLHVGAIAFYLLRKHNLIGSMWHGDKPLLAPVPASRDDAWSRTVALFVFAGCAALVTWLVGLAG